MGVEEGATVQGAAYVWDSRHTEPLDLAVQSLERQFVHNNLNLESAKEQ